MPVITIRFILDKKSELLRRLRFFYNVIATRDWKLYAYSGSPENQITVPVRSNRKSNTKHSFVCR